MHELSIAQALIEKIEEVGKKENAQTIKKIILINSILSGVDSFALRQAFSIAAQNTSAAKAELVIEEEKTKVFCNNCKKEFVPELPFFVCTDCASTDIEIKGNKDLILKSVELETV